MAHVERRVNGMKIEKFIAKNEGVQLRLDRFIMGAKVRAEADLAAHKWDGDTYIVAEKGRIDRTLTMVDPDYARRNSKRAYWPGALTIETGRNAGSGWGAMAGLYILHRAMKASYTTLPGRPARKG